SLQDQAGKLAEAVSVFKLGGMASSPLAALAASQTPPAPQGINAKSRAALVLVARPEKLAAVGGGEWQRF
ncbi:MAG: hypothetical protein IV089_02445, partial [Thiobacillus sp.]|nr:hypothetical protein [Thiobacillus sp.]